MNGWPIWSKESGIKTMNEQKAEISQYSEHQEYLRMMLRKFGAILIQIRKDTDQNGEVGRSAISWAEKDLFDCIEKFISSGVVVDKTKEQNNE